MFNLSNLKWVTTNERSYSEIEAKIENTSALYAQATGKSEHGSLVLAASGAQRQVGHYGIAPDATYYLLDFAEPANVNNWTKAYNGEKYYYGGYSTTLTAYVYATEAKIINFSAFTPMRNTEVENLIKTNDKFKTAYATILSGDQAQFANLHYGELYNTGSVRGNSLYPAPTFYHGLKQIKEENSRSLPLMVFAAGNVVNYVNYLNYTKVINNYDSNVFDSWLSDPLAHPLKITEDSQQAILLYGKKGNDFTLTVDPEVRDSQLYVAGVVTDYNQALSSRVKDVIESFIVNQFGNYNGKTYNKTGAEIMGDVDGIYYDPSSTDVFNKDTLEKKEIYVAPNSLACGAIKYDCLVAPFQFAQITQRTDANSDIESITGTSFAAPIVTGVAALVAEQFPWMTAGQIKQTLTTTAYDLGASGVDDVFGWGMANAQGAVRGPAAFYNTDYFIADMTVATSRNHYVFSNPIVGNGGLLVRGKTNDFLYLKGAKDYTGATLVDSGNLVLAGADSVFVSQLTTNNSPATYKTSRLAISKDAKLYLSNAKVNDLSSNGKLHVAGASTAASLTLEPDATLYLHLAKTNDGTSYATPLTVTGNAKLNGNLDVSIVDTTAAPTQENTVNLLTANTISGNFKVLNFVNTPYVTFDGDSFTVDNKAVSVKYKVNSSTQVAQSLARNTQLSSADSILLQLGATSVQKLLTAAQNQGTTTTSNSANQATVNDDATLTTLYTSAKEFATATNTTTEDTVNTLAATTTTLTAADDKATVTSTVVLTSTSDNPNSTTANSGSTTVLTAGEDGTATQAATIVQGLTAEQLTELFLSQSGVIYSNAQLAANNVFRTHGLDFAKVASSRYLTSDSRVYAYANLNHNQQDWTNNNTIIKGKLETTSGLAGFYTQKQGINFGLAGFYADSTWREYIKDFSTNLGYADIKSAGFFANLGLAANNYWLSATLGLANTSFNVSRTSLTPYDQKAKFDNNQVFLSLQGGYLVLGNQQNGLEINGGLLGQFIRQSGFQEEAQGTLVRNLSLTADARSHVQAYALVGIKGWMNFSLFNLATTVDAAVNLQQRLTNNRFYLGHNKDAYGFTNSFLADLSLGASVQITECVKLRLGGNYSKSGDWDNKGANLSLAVKF